jgi:hypothetical protein
LVTRGLLPPFPRFASLIQGHVLLQELEKRIEEFYASYIELTDDDDNHDNEPTHGIKRERSPSPRATELPAIASNTEESSSRVAHSHRDLQQQQRQQPHAAEPAPATTKAPGPKKKKQRRTTNDVSLIRQFYPCIINNSKGPGGIELRCDLCGTNSQADGRGFLHGTQGMYLHFKHYHSHDLKPGEFYNSANILERCATRYLSPELVAAFNAGDRSIYTVQPAPIPVDFPMRMTGYQSQERLRPFSSVQPYAGQPVGIPKEEWKNHVSSKPLGPSLRDTSAPAAQDTSAQMEPAGGAQIPTMLKAENDDVSVSGDGNNPQLPDRKCYDAGIAESSAAGKSRPANGSGCAILFASIRHAIKMNGVLHENR